VDDTHFLVSEVKRLALELGRSPTRAEFETAVAGAHSKLSALGGFTILLQRAGLDTYEERRSGKKRKIDNSIFMVKDIESFLGNYQPRPIIELPPIPTLASISDIHWPFSSQRVIDRFYEYVGDEKPDNVVINGDAWDMFSHSKYPRSHNVFTPREEERLSRQKNEDFWKEIRRRSPKSKKRQLMGNHDIRPLKRILEEYPSAEDWVKRELERLFTFEDVETTHDPREELFLREDTLVFHGYRSQLGQHRDYTLMNCVNGHTHVGGVVFRKIRGQVIWELNSGVAGDPESKGLSYTPQKITHWTPGFAVIDKLGPRFVSV
jgi:hypothetical protein